MKLVRVINKNNYRDYTTQDLVQKNVNRFFGWKCSAGIEGLFIDWDGNVWPGTCFVGYKDYYLGNINNDQEIKQCINYVTCHLDVCPCLVEIYLPKYKQNKESLEEKTESSDNLLDFGFDAVSRAVNFDKERKYIMWAFGRKCNFECSYCDDVSHSKLDSDLVTFNAIKKVKDYAKKFRQNKPISWSITGGEPTINEFFFNFTKELSELGDTITVSTNGSASNNYYKELAKYANINISVHFEFLKAEKLKKITESILESDPEWVGLNFMVMPGNVTKCYNYLQKLVVIPDFFNKVRCYFDILKVKNETVYQVYSKEDIKILKELKNYKL